ncbi:MAG: hypothetical protein CEO19_284 [Parcubacteria group bacterium Gr01-1014_73]|nr:MAG: hypothetical protein CEO19_284 [Parcubacteria group bacterium Gr01-1014_73]
MKTKTIINLLIIVLVFAGLFVWGYSAKKGGTTASVQGVDGSNNSESSLTASETIYDFGAISMKNGDVNKEFMVTNPTAQDITIKTMLTSCMCTTAFVVKSDGNTKGPFGMAGMGYVSAVDEIIKAGESRVIRVVYNPNAHGPAGVGRIDRFITLIDASGGEFQLEIKALVTP